MSRQDHDQHDDDELLRKLGARVREERDEGELPPGVAPFDDGFADRLASRLLAPSESKKDERDANAKKDAKVIPIASAKPKTTNATTDGTSKKPSPFRWGAAIVPLAAAAAIGAVWIGGGFRSGASGAMPGYEVAITGSKAMRADPSAQPTSPNAPIAVDPKGDFELVARPAVPTSGVAARALLVCGGAPPAPWAAPIDISSEGAVRIQGTTRALFPNPRGECDIVLFVAKSAATLPSDEDATRLAASPSGSSANVRTVRARVRFLAD